MKRATPVLAALAAALVACLAMAPRLAAQTPPQTSDIAASIEKAHAQIRAVAGGAHQGPLSDEQINDKLALLGPIEATLAADVAALTPRLRDADAQLAQLGPAPAAGQPSEPAETANARRAASRFRAAVHADVVEAALVSVEADQLSASLAEDLRANFHARITRRSFSVLDPRLWSGFAAALPDDLGRRSRAWRTEGEKLAAVARSPTTTTWLSLAVLLGALIVGPGRGLLARLAYRRAEALGPPTPLSRTVLALWLVVVAAGTPWVVGLLLRRAFNAADALTPMHDQFAALLIKVVFFGTLIEGLGRAVLSPRRPAWRISPIPDGMVGRLAPFPGLIALSAGLQLFVAGTNTIVGTSLPTSVATDCLTLVVAMLVVGAFLVRLSLARGAGTADPAVHGDRAADGDQSAARLPWIVATLAAWLALGTAAGAVLLGYLAFATLVMREGIWIATVLTILFLLLRLADELPTALLSSTGPLGRAVKRAIGVSDGALDHLGVLISGVARVAVLLLGWILILAPFGASIGEIASRITSADSVLRLGQTTISPSVVAQGVALFLLALFVTQAVRRWLVVRYLPTTHLDVGVRTSVAAAVSYLGVLIGIVLAFAYLGVSFSQIALFASALSVGIGFGLQAIIGNFVSGLILLAERPVRPGDWIAIGDLEGDVKRINIRATEIEMFDRSRLIVPNSDLISKTVRNVTHSVAIGRVKIVLKISDQADPDRVRDLILTLLRAHPTVLSDPGAGVFLSDVRDGAMEFTALAYVASPRQAFVVKSDLLFAIVPALKAAGIDLASGVPVVNIGLSDRLIEPGATTETA